MLIIDLFPPTPRDPFGIHKAVWDEIDDEPLAFPRARVASLFPTRPTAKRSYVEPVAVGDKLPEMPLFLGENYHVFVPLEPTYQATWDASPEDFREAVLTGVLPEPDAE
ncbi:MAG: hypothetical protein U0797_03385 [Gemmataceae bacterium]